jgi:hypothetical protein
MRIGCNGEGGFNNLHDIYLSAVTFGETGASGKMVPGAMVQGAGRADRGGLA